MKRIIFASRNRGKIEEIKAMLAGTGIELLSLLDYPAIPEIEEDGTTFVQNALKKAKTVADHTGELALADDSGIEIDLLGGKPGIYSARYSGLDATDEKNNRKVLSELDGIPLEKRTAAFRCVLVLYNPDGRYKVYEGSWKGFIGFEPRGSLGFGYDPIFIDPELQKTAAELTPDIKNKVSHRAQAFMNLKTDISEAAGRDLFY